MFFLKRQSRLQLIVGGVFLGFILSLLVDEISIEAGLVGGALLGLVIPRMWAQM